MTGVQTCALPILFDMEVNKDFIVKLLGPQTEPKTAAEYRTHREAILLSKLEDVTMLLDELRDNAKIPSVTAVGSAITLEVIPDGDETIDAHGVTDHPPHSIGIWQQPQDEVPENQE